MCTRPRSGVPRRLQMRWNAALRSVLLVGSLALISCGHFGGAGAVTLVGPDRCEGISEEQAKAIQHLLDVLAAYDQHCREDDALMDRP